MDTNRHEDMLPEQVEVRPEPVLAETLPAWTMPARPPRFQHRYSRHVILLLLTLITTSAAGACHQLGFEISMGTAPPPDAGSLSELFRFSSARCQAD